MNREQLRKDIERAINKNSAESGSDTPDFILADYLMNCLDSFNNAVRQREKWYGGENADTSIYNISLDPPTTNRVPPSPINFHKSVPAGETDSSEGCTNTVAYENIPEAIERNATNDQLDKIMLLRGNERQVAEALEYIKVDGRYTNSVKPQESIFTEDEIAIIKKMISKFSRDRKLGKI